MASGSVVAAINSITNLIVLSNTFSPIVPGYSVRRASGPGFANLFCAIYDKELSTLLGKYTYANYILEDPSGKPIAYSDCNGVYSVSPDYVVMGGFVIKK